MDIKNLTALKNPKKKKIRICRIWLTGLIIGLLTLLVAQPAVSLTETGAISSKVVAAKNVGIEITKVEVINDTTIDLFSNTSLNQYTAEKTGNYRVSPYLKVLGVRLREDGRVVRLTLAKMSQDIKYTVSTPASITVFTGIDSTPPRLLTAIAATDQSIVLTFDEGLDIPSAQNLSNYLLSPALEITGARLLPGAGDRVLRLTTARQTRGGNYQLLVQGVRDKSGKSIAANTSALVRGVDTTGPSLVAASAPDGTTIKVDFSEKIDLKSGEDIKNYRLTPPLAIVGTETVGTSVYLTTASQVNGLSYTLEASNLADLSNNRLGSANSVMFIGSDAVPPLLLQTTVPADATVDLVFNEFLDTRTATDRENFSISPVLPVDAVQLLPDGRTIRLTTAQQRQGQLYQVTVRGVSDLQGNPTSAGTAGTFSGRDTIPPVLMRVYAVSDTELDAVFSEQLRPLHAEDLQHYSLTPELTVKKVSLLEDGCTVRIQTTNQAKVEYSLLSGFVADLSGNIATPTVRKFMGIDTIAPRLISTKVINNRAVDLLFNEKLDQVTALVYQNYQINPDLPVENAEMLPGGTGVRLFTMPQVANVQYTVNLKYVTDLAANAVPTGIRPAFTGFNPHASYSTNTGMCARCHSDHQATGYKLVKTEDYNSLCLLCHDGSQSQSNIKAELDNPAGSSHHRGVKGPLQCTDCHNPHGDADGRQPFPRLLRARQADQNLTYKGIDFCWACHGAASTLVTDTVNDQVVNAVYDHQSYWPGNEANANNPNLAGTGHDRLPDDPTGAPLGLGTGPGIKCLACHQEHWSPLPKLLRQQPVSSAGRISVETPAVAGNNPTFCLACHNTAIKDSAWDGQQTLKNGGHRQECLVCHDPHGTPNQKYLVRGQYVLEPAGVDRDVYSYPYQAKDYGACFDGGCHNAAQLTATDFVYGDLPTGFFNWNLAQMEPQNPRVNLHQYHLSLDSWQTGQGNAVCRECHRPHGAIPVENPRLAHQVGFPSVTVSAYDGEKVFIDDPDGPGTGSCQLLCHGVKHDNLGSFNYNNGGHFKFAP